MWKVSFGRWVLVQSVEEILCNLLTLWVRPQCFQTLKLLRPRGFSLLGPGVVLVSVVFITVSAVVASTWMNHNTSSKSIQDLCVSLNATNHPNRDKGTLSLCWSQLYTNRDRSFLHLHTPGRPCVRTVWVLSVCWRHSSFSVWPPLSEFDLQLKDCPAADPRLWLDK